jgi:hypothetical protein
MLSCSSRCVFGVHVHVVAEWVRVMGRSHISYVDELKGDKVDSSCNSSGRCRATQNAISVLFPLEPEGAAVILSSNGWGDDDITDVGLIYGVGYFYRVESLESLQMTALVLS